MILDDPDPDDYRPHHTDPIGPLACVGTVLVIIAFHYFELFGLSFPR